MKFVLSAILLATSQLGFSALLHVQPKASQIEFVAKGRPALISISGDAPFNSGSLSLDDEKLTGTLTVPLQLITTGIDLRDEHLKDKYLEVGKFPTATLTLEGVSVKGDNFEGKLTLHGVEKNITGTKKMTAKDGATRVRATFIVKLSEFNIAIPSFQGITVADVVAVTAELDLKEMK